MGKEHLKKLKMTITGEELSPQHKQALIRVSQRLVIDPDLKKDLIEHGYIRHVLGGHILTEKGEVLLN